MDKTWEEYRSEKQKEFGVTVIIKKADPKPPVPRYESSDLTLVEPRFNIRRIVLPGGKVDVLVYNVTEAEAQWWLEETRTRRRFKTDKIVSPIEGVAPVAIYEPIPSDATEAEKSPYFNKRPFVKDEDPS